MPKRPDNWVSASVIFSIPGLSEQGLQGLKGTLTLKKRKPRAFVFSYDLGDEYVCAFKIVDGYVKVPRAFGLDYAEKHGIKLTDRRSEGQAIDIKFNEELQASRPELKVKQDGVVADVVQGLLHRRENAGILQAATGSGKTPMGIKVACELGRSTLIVVNSEFAMDQWRDRLLQFSDIKKEDIGYIRQEKCELDKPVVIGMIQTLIRREYEGGDRKSFGLIIFDECHHLPAPDFSQAIFKFDAKYLLGLSATPSRSDGLDDILFFALGSVLNQDVIAIQLVPDVYMIRNMLSIPESVYSFPVRYGGSYCRKANLGKLINALVKVEARNDRIAKVTADAAKKDRKVMVFSDRIRHLEGIKRRLDLELGESFSTLFIGGLTEKEREAAKKVPVMLCTYSYAAEALDVPDRDCLILATPKSRVKQVLGRILRGGQNKKTPLVIDFMDQGVKPFEVMAISRTREYRSIRAKLHLPGGEERR